MDWIRRSCEIALREAEQSGWTTLDLAHVVPREGIPDHVWTRTTLRELYLSGNGLSTIPDAIGNLTNLQVLDASSNMLTSLPRSLASIKGLRRLEAGNNQLRTIPAELGELTELRLLDLSMNRLEALPDTLGHLDRLELLEIQHNRIKQPPAAVLEGGTPTIMRYLRGRLDPESAQQWVSKMIIVGEAAVGKTSLTRMLARERFDPDEPQTHGIRTTDLRFRHPSEADVEMTLHTWDFGGQEIYHATHRFFLTERSLFLAVFSSRDGYSKGRLRTWLQAITARAPGSPILIVGTHGDEHPVTAPLQSLRQEFPRIVGFVNIDSQTGRGEEELRAAIADAAAALPLMGNRWPQSWLSATEELRAAGREQAYISPRAMRQRLESVGIHRADDQDAVAGVLHCLGEILSHTDEPELGDLVFVRPHWVSEQITRILDSEELLDRQGVLDQALLDEIWEAIDAPVRRLLIALMEHVDLAYRTDTDTSDDVCLVVEKLSEDPPDYERTWQATKDAAAEIRLVYDFSDFIALQAGIPTWFIAREHRFTTHCHWRYGALLRSPAEHASALLNADPLTRTVELAVRGPYPVAFFSELKASFDRILTERYPGVPYRLLVPCPRRKRDGTACEHLFRYADLRRRLEPDIGRDYIECPSCFAELHVRGLIEGFEPPTLDEIRRILQSSDDKIDRIETRQELTLGFLRSITDRQRSQEVHCPSLFLVTSDRKGLRRQHEVRLRFYCEYPQQWHPIDHDRGTLTFYRPPAWFAPIAPHLRMIVRILRQITPIAGDVAEILGLPMDDRTKAEVELMKDFVDNLPVIQLADDLAPRASAGAPAHLARSEGDFRWLAQILKQADPSMYWGGLTRTTTPDGLTVFVCPKHLESLHYPASPRPV